MQRKMQTKLKVLYKNLYYQIKLGVLMADNILQTQIKQARSTILAPLSGVNCTSFGSVQEVWRNFGLHADGMMCL